MDCQQYSPKPGVSSSGSVGHILMCLSLEEFGDDERVSLFIVDDCIFTSPFSVVMSLF